MPSAWYVSIITLSTPRLNQFRTLFFISDFHQDLAQVISTSPGAFARASGAPEVASAFEAARYGPEWISRGALSELKAAVRGYKPDVH